jgi:hypothetical protein
LARFTGKLAKLFIPEVGEELHRVGALHVLLDHVVRLVEEHRGLRPGGLLVAPVGKFGRHHGIHVGADLGIAKHVDRIAGRLEDFLEVAHLIASSGGEGYSSAMIGSNPALFGPIFGMQPS